jgi:hypothetical protein
MWVPPISKRGQEFNAGRVFDWAALAERAARAVSWRKQISIAGRVG